MVWYIFQSTDRCCKLKHGLRSLLVSTAHTMLHPQNGTCITKIPHTDVTSNRNTILHQRKHRVPMHIHTNNGCESYERASVHRQTQLNSVLLHPSRSLSAPHHLSPPTASLPGRNIFLGMKMFQYDPLMRKKEKRIHVQWALRPTCGSWNLESALRVWSLSRRSLVILVPGMRALGDQHDKFGGDYSPQRDRMSTSS